MIHGLIVINKKPTITSHDVVNRVRRVFQTRKVGHFGTLDPMAEGILLVGIGHVTKFFNFFVKKKKTYTGTIKFGYSTDTYDKLGVQDSETKPIDLYSVDLQRLVTKFTGTIEQYPPKYSAKKRNGKPLYKYARENIDIDIKPSTVTIYKLELKIIDKTTLAFQTQTSEGTYIRSIAHDMGGCLDCGAHLSQLTRSMVGGFSLNQAIPFDKLEIDLMENELLKMVIPFEGLLTDFPKVVVNKYAESIVMNGGLAKNSDLNELSDYDSDVINFRIFSESGKLLAIAKPDVLGFKPFMVFSD
jgi:tRNA pseudouridine55 synthase